MNLLLIRHADAERQATTDFARTLTEKGRRQSSRVGAFLAGLEIRPEYIISSPLVRAVQTAELLHAELTPPRAVVVDERLACGMTPDQAYGMLWDCEAAGCVILVGHEPDFSGLVADLTAMDSAVCVEIKKASVAFFDLDTPGRGGGCLRYLVPPKLLP